MSVNTVLSERGVLLEAKNLFCERDERVLFQNLHFSVRQGEIVQIEGPNGAGKTTLLRIISGISAAFEGEVYWRGKDIADFRAEYQCNMLYLGHKPAVKQMLNPMENLRVLVGMHRQISETDILAALAKVGLKGFEDVPCHSLSAGQQRRVALARLYLSDEPLWILDEAFTAIDKKGVSELEMLLVKRAESGGAIVMTTHHEMSLPCGQQAEGEVHFSKLNLTGISGPRA